jgi:hypothetical protein
MRNLSPPIQSALANTAQNVVWICSIEWPDGAAWYSTRDAALADRAVSNCMSGPGTLEMEASRVIGPRRSAPRSRLRVSLRLEGLPAPAVRERMERWEPEGLELRWGVLFLEPDRTPESADVVWLFAGFIERCVLTRTELQLECLDWVEIRGRKRFGRERDARSLPEGAAAVGRMVPWLFGAPGPVELLPWRVGPRRRAARTILPADTAIPVDSVEGLPERGVVQIGDERIVYESLDAVARTLGSASLPLARPEAAFHPEGTALVLMPAQGFEWVVAEHPCQAVERILADGLDLHPGDWSPATEDLDGESVQKVGSAATQRRLRSGRLGCRKRDHGGASPTRRGRLRDDFRDPVRAGRSGPESALEPEPRARQTALRPASLDGLDGAAPLRGALGGFDDFAHALSERRARPLCSRSPSPRGAKRRLGRGPP